MMNGLPPGRVRAVEMTSLVVAGVMLWAAMVCDVRSAFGSPSADMVPPALSDITDDGLDTLRLTMKRLDDAILSCDAGRVMSFVSKDIRFRTIDASGPDEEKTEFGFDSMFESMKEIYAGLQDYSYKRTHVRLARNLRAGTATSYDTIHETARISNKPIFIRSEQSATFRREGGRWVLVELQTRITECRDINVAAVTP